MAVIVAGATLAFAPAPAEARVTIRPNVGIEQAIDLSTNDGDDFLTWTEVTAGINGSVESRRVQGTLGYRFRQRIEEIGEVSNSQSHNLLGRIGADVIPNLLSFDAGASASLTDLRPGFLTVDVVGNDPTLTQTLTAYAEPRLTRELGSFAVLDASYRYSIFEADDDRGRTGQALLPAFSVSDAVTHTANVSLRNKPRSSRLSWSLIGSFSDDESELLDGRFRSYRGVAEVEYALNRTLSLIGSGGYEDVRNTELPILYDDIGLPLIGPDGGFIINPGAPRNVIYERKGLVWDAGVRLTPSRRTHALFRFGESAGATNINAQLEYRPTSRLAFRGSWTEELTTNARQRSSNLSGLPLAFLLGLDRVGPGECVLGRDPNTGGCINLGIGSLNNSVYRSRLGSFVVDYRRGRTQLQLVASYYRRRYLNSQQFDIPGFPELQNGRVESGYGLIGLVQQELGGGRSFTASAFVERSKSDLFLTGEEQWYGGLDGEYRAQMTRHIELGGRGNISRRFNDVSDSQTQIIFLGFARYHF